MKKVIGAKVNWSNKYRILRSFIIYHSSKNQTSPSIHSAPSDHGFLRLPSILALHEICLFTIPTTSWFVIYASQFPRVSLCRSCIQYILVSVKFSNPASLIISPRHVNFSFRVHFLKTSLLLECAVYIFSIFVLPYFCCITFLSHL